MAVQIIRREDYAAPRIESDLGATLRDMFERIRVGRMQAEEMQRRRAADERAAEQQRLAVEREQRLAENADLRRQLDIRSAIEAHARQPLPGAPPTGELPPGIAGHPAEPPPPPTMELPEVSLGGKQIIPPELIQRVFQSEVLDRRRAQEEAERQKQGYAKSTPEIVAELSKINPLAALLYPPGGEQLIPPQLIAQLTKPTTPGVAHDVLDTKTGRPTRVTPEQEAASPGRYAPYRAERGAGDETQIVQDYVDMMREGGITVDRINPPSLRNRVVSAARAQGIKPVTQKMADAIDSVANARNVVDSITKASEEYNTLKSGPAAAARGTIGNIGALVGLDKATRQFNRTLGLMAPVIRALGEKGTLAEGDVQRALALIPTATDDADTAQKKLGELSIILDNADAIARGEARRTGKQTALPTETKTALDKLFGKER